MEVVPEGANTLVLLGSILGLLALTRRFDRNSSEKRVLPTAEILATCAITELGFVRVSVQSGLQPNSRALEDCEYHAVAAVPPTIHQQHPTLLPG